MKEPKERMSELEKRAAPRGGGAAGSKAPGAVDGDPGRAAVGMSQVDSEDCAERERFLRAIEEGLADVAAGRVVDDAEVRTLLGFDDG